MSSKPRILIVDDEVDFAESLGFLLAHDSYPVDWAFDGYEALERLLVEQFDFVITDFRMPNMNGSQLMNMFSKQPGKGPKFIVISGNINLIKPDDLNANVVAIFPKSIGYAQLCKKLESEYEKVGSLKLSS